MRPVSRLLVVPFLPLILAGCISVPDYVKADMEPPDGTRPNNYGRYATEGDELRRPVEPDRPTIAPMERAK